MSSDVLLTSKSVAKEMLQTALGSCGNLYLIIDGLDECIPKERKEIASWFQSAAENLTAMGMDPPRCLFVSQDDEVALHDFQDLPVIKITGDNSDDLADFAKVWHKRIERKFGALRSNNLHIARIICARSQGKLRIDLVYKHYSNGSRNVHLCRTVCKVSRGSNQPSRPFTRT